MEEPDVEDDDDEAVGGDEDREVELEHVDATSEEPFDELPLELAAQLTRFATATAALLLVVLLLLLSTTSVSFSIRCRLMTGCPLLLFRFEDVGDGVDIMATSVAVAMVDDVAVDPLSVTIATAEDDPVGSKGPRPCFGSFSF